MQQAMMKWTAETGICYEPIIQWSSIQVIPNKLIMGVGTQSAC